MSFFIVTISQCYLPNRMTVSLKLVINVIEESQAENRSVPVVVLGGCARDNSCSPLTVSVR